MSLANRSAQMSGHAPTLCPYCAHVSPLDSKFCNECGAALHLVPCPQCGSINDITQTAHCSRCNCALHVSAFALSDFPDLPAEPKEPELPPVLVAALVAESKASDLPPVLLSASFDSEAARDQPPLLEPVEPFDYGATPAARRPRAVLVGGLLLIAAAAAAYFWVQQRDEPLVAQSRAVARPISPLVAQPMPSSNRATGSVDAASAGTALAAPTTGTASPVLL
ncbi:zinc ribbon domain-containing protein, partial [Roseateles sp. GG27B]